MKRTTFAASLVGSAAGGLMAATIAVPAWAQATTFPEGTDCSAIQNTASRMDCTTQMNESRQNQNPQQPGTPDATTPDAGAAGTTGVAPPTPGAPGTGDATGTGNGTGGTPGVGGGASTQ